MGQGRPDALAGNSNQHTTPDRREVNLVGPSPFFLQLDYAFGVCTGKSKITWLTYNFIP
jgi:hypothetical protein